MTKAEWISVIQRTLLPIDEQGRYRAPFVEKHIQSVYEQMYNELYSQNPKTIWKYVKTYFEQKTEEYNGSTGVTMPYDPISLPREGGGVFAVAITAESTDSPASYAEILISSYQGFLNSLQSRYDTAGFKGRYIGTVHNNKFYWSNTAANPASYIVWRMIPKFTSLATTDEVMIPFGNEEMFIDRVIDTIQHTPPVDLINDNTIQ